MRFTFPLNVIRYFVFVELLWVLAAQSVSYAQIHIREQVEIKRDSFLASLAKGGKQPPPAVTSGFVIPRSSGLRTSLQVQFGLVEKLDYEMPPYASLNAYFRDSTKVSPLISHLPISSQNWWEYYNGCNSHNEWRLKYQYEQSVSTGWDTVGRVFRGDTITFAYITNRIDQPSVRDTIPILITDTVKVREPNGDSVVVGWNVTLGRYNLCIDEYNDHLDAFIGLNCATYTRLSQGDARWGDSLYLWANYRTTGGRDSTIQNLGCATTSLAIVGQAFGLGVTPGSLNHYMRETFAFSADESLSVKWEALNNWDGNDRVKDVRRIGKGLRGSRGTPLSLDTLDFHLNLCRPVVAQVLNPRTNRNHWVVVKQKNAQGRYPIVDPGYPDRLFLDNPDPKKNYRNIVYRLIVFGLK